jgi:hypothetical protein
MIDDVLLGTTPFAFILLPFGELKLVLPTSTKKMEVVTRKNILELAKHVLFIFIPD